MNSNLKHILLFITALTVLQACKKEINQGAKIKGKIMAVDVNNDSTCIENASVFLVSTTKEEFTLKRKTGKKGGFKFKNIPAGEYELMIYTKSLLNKKKDSCIIKTIIVNEDQSLVQLEPIITVMTAQKELN